MDKQKLKLRICENPVLVLFLGACPAMAVTTDVRSALTMAGIILVLLLVSGLVMALLGRFFTKTARIAVPVLLNAALAISAQLLLTIIDSDVHSMIGIYAALLAINLSILDASESAVSGIVPAILNALLTGLMLAAALFAVASVREVFGNASFMGSRIEALADYKVAILLKAPGGFGVLAVCAAILSKLKGPAAVSGSIACSAAGLTEEV